MKAWPVLALLILTSLGCDPEKAPGPEPPRPEVKQKAELKTGVETGPDRHFRKWGRTFFARQVDWRWFKAQGMAESGLCPKAVSPAGAMGLMQLMPSTSREMSARLGVEDRPLDPELSIMMGIAYDRRLWDQWAAPRPCLERLRFTFASYNAGLGNILRAQKLVERGCDTGQWSCVAARLSRVTGGKAQETLNYIARIEAVYSGYGDQGG